MVGRPRSPSARTEEVLAGIGTAVDATGGGFTMRYTAMVVTAMVVIAARTGAA
ncbi:hypothetical protein ABZV14_41775 [Streptosporangium canum]|uniref:hypothetical protein n=1 Tax=Streptosporangium canum TaxID=324952 RepID=UPI0033A1D911